MDILSLGTVFALLLNEQKQVIFFTIFIVYMLKNYLFYGYIKSWHGICIIIE
jgi:hypothetical protein